MKIFLAVAAALIACAAPVWAHHAHGHYAQEKPINLSGVITEVHWLNPHTWLYMEVTDARGEKFVWPLEGTSTAGLVRAGWNKDSIKVGDRVSVRCFPLKDGDRGCLLGFVTAINGVMMDKEFN